MDLAVERLVEHGWSAELIACLVDSGITHLRGPQARALLGGDLFSRDNLLICLPTSAGKTLLGELASLHRILAGQKAIFAAPLKALAEEKYAEWQARYSRYGLSVVCSTADHSHDDRRLSSGNFDLAVVIYEKLRHFLVQAPRLFEQVGVIVWDELQMLSDPQRGPLAEMLIAHLLDKYPGVRHVGLSAVLDYPEDLAHYFSARVLRTEQRPRALRRGILHEGRFAYTSEPDESAGEEYWPELDQGYGGVSEQALDLLVHFAEAGEPTLLFVSSRLEARGLALEVADRLSERPAERCLAELERMEENEVGEHLAYTLRRGAAYHNGDLTPAQRRLVELGCRRGEIGTLVATSTLSMGVNLPVHNVIVLPYGWTGAPDEAPDRRLLEPREWINRAGRAGRGDEPFGRAILPAVTRREVDLYRRRFMECGQERLPMFLAGSHVVGAIPLLVRWSYDRPERLAEFCRGTLSGSSRLRPGIELPDWDEEVARGLERCAGAGLVAAERGGAYRCTRLGQTVAERGLGLDEAEALLGFWNRAGAGISEGTLLFFCCTLGPARQMVFPVERDPRRRGRYAAEVRDWLGGELALIEPRLAEAPRWEGMWEAAAKRVLAARAWTDGEAGLVIEERFQVAQGRLYELADGLAWLVSSGLELGRNLGLNLSALESLPARIQHGLPEDALGLLDCRVPGMGRAEMLRLRAEGLSTEDAVCGASPELLRRLLPAELVKRLEAELGPLGVPPEKRPAAPDHLQIDGIPAGRRVVVRLNDRPVELRLRSFELLVLLAWHARHGQPWIPKHRLGLYPDNANQYLSRLRRDLLPWQIQPGEPLVQSDGTGRVRLTVHPDRIEMDAPALTRRWAGLHLPHPRSSIELLET